jgi:hypothetical protein
VEDVAFVIPIGCREGERIVADGETITKGERRFAEGETFTEGEEVSMV